MKLYRITSPEHTFEEDDSVSPKKVLWAGTQADARKVRIGYEDAFKDIAAKRRPKVLVEEIDVPTNKADLLAFLNNGSNPVK